jgi:hypothetical protein
VEAGVLELEEDLAGRWGYAVEDGSKSFEDESWDGCDRPFGASAAETVRPEECACAGIDGPDVALAACPVDHGVVASDVEAGPVPCARCDGVVGGGDGLAFPDRPVSDVRAVEGIVDAVLVGGADELLG